LNGAGAAEKAGLQHIVTTVKSHTAPPSCDSSFDGFLSFSDAEMGAARWIESKRMIAPINPETN
jgi:hypothetical protein